MITFFTIPKPFRGLFATIQRNAITSWTKLTPRPEVILMGDDAGVADFAAELGLLHCPQVATNEYGTPVVSGLFRLARAHASYRILNYINTDIILFDDYKNVADFAENYLDRFLIAGRRQDLYVDTDLDFSVSDWQDQLRAETQARGRFHPNSGVDYFIFDRDLFFNVPDFAVGRTFYDNWFFWYCRNRGVDIIDATEVMTCVHQDHERSYSSIGRVPVNQMNLLRRSDEAARNVRLGGGRLHAYKIMDATHKLTASGLVPVSGARYWPYRVRRFLATHPLTTPVFRPLWNGVAKLRGLPV
jgi:hypothetical protein